jgi:hypothetical protein
MGHMENRCSFQNVLFLETLDDAQIPKKNIILPSAIYPRQNPIELIFIFFLVSASILDTFLGRN